MKAIWGMVTSRLTRCWDEIAYRFERFVYFLEDCWEKINHALAWPINLLFYWYHRRQGRKFLPALESFFEVHMEMLAPETRGQVDVPGWGRCRFTSEGDGSKCRTSVLYFQKGEDAPHLLVTHHKNFYVAHLSLSSHGGEVSYWKEDRVGPFETNAFFPSRGLF